MLNIVDPTSTITHQSAPFTLVGNRGVLHKDNRIVRHADGDDWIYCVTNALEDPREFMAPRHYTDLFFLDEATALAAGHRPCARCHRDRYAEFVTAWEHAHNGKAFQALAIDAELKSARTFRDRQRTFRADITALPSGVMIRTEGRTQPLLLVSYTPRNKKGDRAGKERWCVYPWTPHGYGLKEPRPEGMVEVLTPKPIVETIRHGFVPGPTHPLLAW
jgi:hypothetical protein